MSAKASPCRGELFLHSNSSFGDQLNQPSSSAINPTSLQLYAVALPPCSTVNSKHTKLAGHSVREPELPDLSFSVSVCPSSFLFPPPLGQSLELCRAQWKCTHLPNSLRIWGGHARVCDPEHLRQPQNFLERCEESWVLVLLGCISLGRLTRDLR